MTRGDGDTATDKRVRECHAEPDQEALFAYADGTSADRVIELTLSVSVSQTLVKTGRRF